MEVGDYVQTHRRVRNLRGGQRGTLRSVDGDWVTVELPTGGRVLTHIDNIARLLRASEIKENS